MEPQPAGSCSSQGRIKAIEQGSVHRICAGQVVTSLAIAIKELVENAIDAGATVVEVRLREYGAESIEVVDNGHGIAPADWPALTARHATSKIQAFEDVYSVSSYGFRGEAVSSLCELSGSFTVLTRAAGHTVGTRLIYDRGGGLVGKEPTARAQGTTVTVTDLFKPLPVRRREFLKGLKKQYARALSVLQSYALIASHVRLLVVHTATGSSGRELQASGGGAGTGTGAGGGRKSVGAAWDSEAGAGAGGGGGEAAGPSTPLGQRTVVLNTTGSGSMGAALTEVWGAKFTAGMVPVDIPVPLPQSAVGTLGQGGGKGKGKGMEEDDEEEAEPPSPSPAPPPPCTARVYGYVSKLDSGIGRSSGDRCFLYLSGRPVDMPRLAKLASDTWRGYELQHKPALVLDLAGLPPGTWDINLSPDKREVLLSPAVEACVAEAVRGVLGGLWEAGSRSFTVSPLVQQGLAWEGVGAGGTGTGVGGGSASAASSSSSSVAAKSAPSSLSPPPVSLSSPPPPQAAAPAPAPAPVVAAAQEPPAPLAEASMAGTAAASQTQSSIVCIEDEGEREGEESLPPLLPPGSAQGGVLSTPGIGPGQGSRSAQTSTSSASSPQAGGGGGGGVGALLGLPSRRAGPTSPSPAPAPPPPHSQPQAEVEEAAMEEEGEEEVYSVGAASGSTGTGTGGGVGRALPRARTLHSSTGHGYGSGSGGTAAGERKRARTAADPPSATQPDRPQHQQQQHQQQREEEEEEEDVSVGQLQARGCTSCPGHHSTSSLDGPGQHEGADQVREEEQGHTNLSPPPALPPSSSSSSVPTQRQVERMPLEACRALYQARARAGPLPPVFHTFADSDLPETQTQAQARARAHGGEGAAGEGAHAVHAGLGGEGQGGASTPLPSPTDAEHMLSTRLLTKDAFPCLARGCVGQFNLGFLVARAGEDMYILDQHACDEKAQFERLVRDTVLHEQQLLVPLPCELTPAEESTVLAHLPLFAANGLHLTVREGRPAGQRLALTAVPFSKGVSFGVEDVRELASLLMAQGAGGRGGSGLGDGRTLLGLQGRTQLPKVRTMLASRACRSAIMIGSALKRDVSRRVISSLAGLHAPWSCPHGRPTMRHLVHLGGLQGMGAAARGLLPPGPDFLPPQQQQGDGEGEQEQ